MFNHQYHISVYHLLPVDLILINFVTCMLYRISELPVVLQVNY